MDTFSRDWISAVGGPQVTGATTSGGNVSFGGAGGAGLIQLHVPDSLTPPADTLGASSVVVPTQSIGTGTPLDAIASPAAIPLIPAFGATSQARSKWISIGGADKKPSGIPAQLLFLFQGIETAVGPDEGKVLVSGEDVQELPALLDADLENNPDAIVLSDRLSLRLSGSALDPFSGMTNGVSNDLYLRNPALLRDFVLRLSVASVTEDFRVAGAEYDEGADNNPNDQALTMTATEEGTDLQDFIDENTSLGTVRYTLLPRYFRVLTAGEEGRIPTSSYVRILFQATGADTNGQPNATPLVDWTADISQFNSVTAGELQFFRFEVEFELNDGGMSVPPDTEAVSLDFLRIPFVF